MMRSRFSERLMEGLTWTSGLLVMALIVAIFFFLATESRHAFRRTFPYGYRVALLPADSPERLDLGTELYASFILHIPKGPMV